MLTPGVVYDPNRHPRESAPTSPAQPIDASGLTYRTAEDGTVYCGCCDMSIRRPSKRGGRQAIVCTAHTEKRRTATKTDFNDRQQADTARRRAGQETWTGLSVRNVVELLEVIDHLNTAIGRAASHFKTQEQGTWQHELLLASKDLIKWRDDNLTDQDGMPLHPPQRNTNR